MSETPALLPGPEPAQTEQPLLTHLLELRLRIIHALIGWLLVFAPLAVFRNRLYDFLAGPLTRALPKGTSIIAVGMISPFLVPLKLAAIMAMILAAPWLLYQVWGFVAPGLYRHERRLFAPVMVVSTLLFYSGVAFAYFVVLPTITTIMVNATPDSARAMPDIGQYLDFVLALFLAFGSAAEVPVGVVLLCWLGVVSPKSLRSSRGYVLVGISVVAAIITPPDVFSQMLVAIPAYILYEVGILWAVWVTRMREKGAADKEAAASGSKG